MEEDTSSHQAIMHRCNPLFHPFTMALVLFEDLRQSWDEQHMAAHFPLLSPAAAVSSKTGRRQWNWL